MKDDGAVDRQIVPVTEWTWMVIQIVRSEMVKENYDQRLVSDDFFKEAVLNIIDDVISERLSWAEPKHKLENFLDSVPWFNSVEEFPGFIYSILDRVIIVKIRQIFEHLIPQNSTNVWTLIELSENGIFFLEKGEDYRIIEYYRLKRQYEPDPIEPIGFDQDEAYHAEKSYNHLWSKKVDGRDYNNIWARLVTGGLSKVSDSDSLTSVIAGKPEPDDSVLEEKRVLALEEKLKKWRNK